MATGDRISYDTAVSGNVQTDIARIIGRLEGLIALRNSQVATAMANFQADGVSDQYANVERRWHTSAHEVNQIIGLVKRTLHLNDGQAGITLQKARSAVNSIG